MSSRDTIYLPLSTYLPTSLYFLYLTQSTRTLLFYFSSVHLETPLVLMVDKTERLLQQLWLMLLSSLMVAYLSTS
jgi:hypothetical protein